MASAPTKRGGRPVATAGMCLSLHCSLWPLMPATARALHCADSRGGTSDPQPADRLQLRLGKSHMQHLQADDELSSNRLCFHSEPSHEEAMPHPCFTQKETGPKDVSDMPSVSKMEPALTPIL